MTQNKTAQAGEPAPSKFYELPRSAQAEMTIVMMVMTQSGNAVERLEFHGRILAQLREQQIGRI